MMVAKTALRTDLFVAGKWQAASRKKRIPVIDPSTETLIANVADATVEDGLAAVDAAVAAAAGWAATPPRVRSEILRRAFEIMTGRAETLAVLISRENGKALADARGEIAYAAEFFRWYAEEAVRIGGEIGVSPAGNNHMVVQYRPIGVAILVTPWNFPAAMATRKIGPALAAGCTCVLKPATETPLTAYAIAEILAEAGVPDGVVNVVTTSRSGSVVSKMLHHPAVRKLSFTGSTEVGRILLKEAADQVVSCSMELGGNAPFVVFDDADLDAAVDGAMIAKMRNGGEACTAANRFYVQEGISQVFAERLAARMKVLAVGLGYDAKTDLGPLVNAASRDKVAELVADATARGAAVLTGGKAIDGIGYFYLPTVLACVPHDAAIFSHEIFGPVAPIATFKTENEAIKLANRTEFGLVSYVYTRDLQKGLRVSAAIESGMVGLNRGLVSDVAAPFGGMKQSGLGREGGPHGLMEYLEPQYIAVTL